MYSLGYLIMLLSYVIFCTVVIVTKFKRNYSYDYKTRNKNNILYLTLLEIFILNSNKTIAQQYITVGTLLSIRK
jgi:hypothetical protein